MGVTLKAGESVTHPLAAVSQVYLAPARGSLLVNGEFVGTGDGIALREERRVLIEAAEDAEVVMVEVQ